MDAGTLFVTFSISNKEPAAALEKRDGNSVLTYPSFQRQELSPYLKVINMRVTTSILLLQISEKSENITQLDFEKQRIPWKFSAQENSQSFQLSYFFANSVFK